MDDSLYAGAHVCIHLFVDPAIASTDVWLLLHKPVPLLMPNLPSQPRQMQLPMNFSLMLWNTLSVRWLCEWGKAGSGHMACFSWFPRGVLTNYHWRWRIQFVGLFKVFCSFFVFPFFCSMFSLFYVFREFWQSIGISGFSFVKHSWQSWQKSAFSSPCRIALFRRRLWSNKFLL